MAACVHFSSAALLVAKRRRRMHKRQRQARRGINRRQRSGRQCGAGPGGQRCQYGGVQRGQGGCEVR